MLPEYIQDDQVFCETAESFKRFDLETVYWLLSSTETIIAIDVANGKEPEQAAESQRKALEYLILKQHPVQKYRQYLEMKRDSSELAEEFRDRYVKLRLAKKGDQNIRQT